MKGKKMEKPQNVFNLLSPKGLQVGSHFNSSLSKLHDQDTHCVVKIYNRQLLNG